MGQRHMGVLCFHLGYLVKIVKVFGGGGFCWPFGFLNYLLINDN